MVTTSRLAVTSVVFGALGLFLPFFGSFKLGLLCGFLGILIGSVASGKIRETADLSGRPYAWTGISLGCFSFFAVFLLYTGAIGFGAFEGEELFDPVSQCVEAHGFPCDANPLKYNEVSFSFQNRKVERMTVNFLSRMETHGKICHDVQIDNGSGFAAINGQEISIGNTATIRLLCSNVDLNGLVEASVFLGYGSMESKNNGTLQFNLKVRN